MLKITLNLTRAAFVLAVAASAHGAYITDELRAEMRSGASNQHRITNFLPAGTRVDVLGEENDFTRVRTARGSEGWVPSQYVTSTPSAADRLVAAQARIDKLEELAQSGDQKSFQLMNDLETTTARAEQLDSDLTQARTELEEIRTISSNAVQVFQEKQRLTELNERLRDELEDLAADRERLAENLQRQWLFMGAGLIFIGLILGVLIKSRPRRSGWS